MVTVGHTDLNIKSFFNLCRGSVVLNTNKFTLWMRNWCVEKHLPFPSLLVWDRLLGLGLSDSMTCMVPCCIGIGRVTTVAVGMVWTTEPAIELLLTVVRAGGGGLRACMARSSLAYSCRCLSNRHWNFQSWLRVESCKKSTETQGESTGQDGIYTASKQSI